MNVVSTILRSEEERHQLEQMEHLKRVGNHFIRIIYKGKSQMPRFHGLDQVGVSFVEDPDSGTVKAVAEYGNRKTDVQEFKQSLTGELYSDVVDTHHNRYWLSRHLWDKNHPERRETIDIEDEKLKVEIAALINQPYTESMARQNELAKKKAEIERELAEIESQTKGADIPPQTPSTVPQSQVASAPAPSPQTTTPPPVVRRRPGRPAKRKAASDALNAQAQGSA